MNQDDSVQQVNAIDSPAHVLDRERERLHAARDAVGKIVVGQQRAIHELFLSLICGGHVLLEGAPGLGKTLLVRTIGAVCGLRFSRIQFTPDLMPADVTGSVTLVHDDVGRTSTRFEPGPIFAELVLADEINRATPKTQSALLEAMQERTVTVAGTEHPVPNPFFVLATQNPIEMEGTYDLPEAQIDRFFFKVRIGYPDEQTLGGILDATTGWAEPRASRILDPSVILDIQQLIREVPLPSHVRSAVVSFVLATQPEHNASTKDVQRFVRFGISPRGAQAWVLAAKAAAFVAGRNNVSFEDLRTVAEPALAHRLQVTFQGEAEGIDATHLLNELLKQHVG